MTSPALAAAPDAGVLPGPILDRVDPEVITIEELAALLRVNHKTVREAIARGEIPGVRRIGVAVRIYRAAVIDWLSKGQGRASGSRRIR